MPKIIFQVTDEEKELWVREAHREMVTLSEWLRRAARKSLYAEPVGAPPVPISPTAWQTAVAVEEVAVGPAPPEGHEVVLATTSPAASTAKCRKEAMHHIYHAGKPCPVCGFPSREGS